MTVTKRKWIVLT